MNERIAACSVGNDGASEIEGKAGVHPLLEVRESLEQQKRGSYEFCSPEESKNVVRIPEAASPFENLWRVAQLLNTGNHHPGRK